MASFTSQTSNFLIKLIKNHFRHNNFSTSSSSHTKNNPSHYDSLGVTTKATQADIKSAYYKLSMIYHPDKTTSTQTNENNAKKFRDITEAYEILGNVKSRKLYDRGLYFRDAVGTRGDGGVTVDEAPAHKFYKSRDQRSRPPAPHGRTMVYDFEEWSRLHYGATLARDLRTKRSRSMNAAREAQMQTDGKKERAVLSVFAVVLLVIYALKSVDYDEATMPDRKSK